MIFFLSGFVRGAELNPGLVAKYSDGSHRVRLVVPSPNLYLNRNESVHPALASSFEAEWTGLITILRTGTYTFECAAEVYLDGKDVNGQAIRLDSGRHPIRIKFRRAPGTVRVQLRWRSEDFTWEPVPSALFFHDSSVSLADEDTMIERGRTLVEEYGCVNCHRSDSPSLQKRMGPHLTGTGSRTKSRWLFAWLEDSWAYRTGSVMPSMLDQRQRRDVASYLATLGEGIPREPTASPSRVQVARGRQHYGELGCATCHQAGSLPLDGLGSKTTISSLAAYLKDPARVDPSGRMPSMMLSDEEALDLASFLIESRNAAFERDWPSGEAARGRDLVRREGCLACHALEDPAPVKNEHAAPRLEELTPVRGCLAAEPRGVPRYRLSRDERLDIQSFLRSYKRHPDRSPAPVYDLRRSVVRLRCVACHEMDHQKASGSPAESAPPLTDVGAKLRTSWIASVLADRRRVLDWMDLRMPDYDASVVGSMVAGFSQAAGVDPGDGPAAHPASDEQRTRGVELIGMNFKKGGMACLGCHDWGTYKSQGESGPQLIDVVQRLRYDWFERWMLNPSRILSGTSMPNYFRSAGIEPALATIHTLWSALSMGEKMPLPEGLRRAGAVLGSEEKPHPEREAIIIRWDMPESTPAAIAVGLPGGISYCFDAGESRLRYAWEGGFLDMSGTLHRKVDESRLTPTAKPIGAIFYRTDGFPLRVGSIDREPERRFRGYRLVGGYPQFHYQVDGIDVFERIVPGKNLTGLTREFAIRPVDRPMWFLASPTSGVTLSSTLGSFKEGRLLIPRAAETRFEVTVLKKE